MTMADVLTGLGITILGGLTGHNYIQISRLRERTPEIYRAKEDCKDICEEFRDMTKSIHKEMSEGFNRIYDKLEGKEDKE